MTGESSLNLKEIINILKGETNHEYVDWEDVTLDDGEKTRRRDDFRCWLHWQKVQFYEIEAQEFLFFAKQDLQEGSDRGMINALSNAKRAIECRMDELISLWNLNGFSSRHGWKLPYKMHVLQMFDIPAPSILRKLITQKRNLLEHEYIRPKDQQEIQNVVDITELFLKATDRYVERGYISSATVTHTSWFDENVSLVTTGKKAKKRIARYWGLRNEYKLVFDPKSRTITLTYLENELVREQGFGSLSERLLGQLTQRGPIIVTIDDCELEDIRELMILLREKGND